MKEKKKKKKSSLASHGFQSEGEVPWNCIRILQDTRCLPPESCFDSFPFCSLQWNCNTGSFWDGNALSFIASLVAVSFEDLALAWRPLRSCSCWDRCYSISSSPVSSLSPRRPFLCYVVEFRHHETMWLWPRTCGWERCVPFPNTRQHNRVCEMLFLVASGKATAEFQVAAAPSAPLIWWPQGTEPLAPLIDTGMKSTLNCITSFRLLCYFSIIHSILNDRKIFQDSFSLGLILSITFNQCLKPRPSKLFL